MPGTGELDGRGAAEAELTPEPSGEADPAVILAEQLQAEKEARLAAEDRALRWRADFENLRRRTQLETEQLRAGLTQGIILKFLPVLDDLELALATAAGEAPPSWLAGLDMVRRRFLAALGEQGLTRLDPVGQPFDPEKHEAMLRVEDSGLPPNTVVEELRSGYVLGTRVIRPALVKVQA